MILDVRGEICPYPMLKTVEALRHLPPGEMLEVYTDHPPALETIPTQAARLGFAWRIEPVKPGEWRILIYREGTPTPSPVEGTGEASSSPRLISAEQLLRRLEDRALRILDVRPVLPEAASGYPFGHIPGAIHLNLEALLAPAGPAPEPLPSLPLLEARLGALGLRREDAVVIVDSDFGPAAGLAAWLLEYLGQASVAILEGGWQAWLAVRGPVEREGRSLPPARYQAQPEPARLATADWILQHASRPDLLLLDVRTRSEYVQGHLPGALHLPWEECLEPYPYPRLLPADLLKNRLSEMGIIPEKEIVVYCESGARSAHTYWVLRLLGYPRVRNYKGSWADWRSRGLHYVTGETPT
ncbi:rhodanese-like domain-containing protein [Thermoflexus sp.]|uniref:rhodanese-like domain-containing protein n=1 Tax=Thermoflexus sp. TaxID=1969742 RepID=UPI0035E44D08